MKVLLDKKSELEGLLNELKLSGHPVLQKKAKVYAKQLTNDLPSEKKSVDIDPKKLVEALQKLAEKISKIKSADLNYNQILNLETSMSLMKMRVHAARKRGKELKPSELADINDEWDVLKASLSNIDEKLLERSANKIDELLKIQTNESRSKAIDLFTELKKSYTRFKKIWEDNGQKGDPSEHGNYLKLEALIKKQDAKVIKTIDNGKEVIIPYSLTITHFKKEKFFKKKEDLINELKNKAINKVILKELKEKARHEVIDTKEDLEKFIKTFAEGKEKDYEKELKEIKKAFSKGVVTDLTLPIHLKKVKVDAREGWVIDANKTKAPTAFLGLGEASLTTKPKVKVVIDTSKSGNKLTSKFIYTIDIVRSAYTHPQFQVLKFIAGMLVGGGDTIISAVNGRTAKVATVITNTEKEDENKKVTTGKAKTTTTTTGNNNNVGAKVIKHLGNGATLLNESFKNRNVVASNVCLICTITLEWDLDKGQYANIQANFAGDISNLDGRKKRHHFYQSNMSKAFDDLKEELKTNKAFKK